MSNAASPAGSTNLPTPLTALVGREREVAALVDLLRRDDVRLLTLTGPGGVGKTRLALAAAQVIQDEYVDGVYFVPLDSIHDSTLVVTTIAQALGLSELGGRPLFERLTDYLRERQLLLVLDNFEHVTTAAPVIVQLLATCVRLEALVTSRAILRVSGEHAFPVPPLPLPDPDRLPLIAELEEFAAIALFVARAQAIKPDFALAERNAAAVTAICARLDGLPLAIELAAARVRHLPLTALLERLEGATRHPARLGVLTGGARDAPQRLRTMRDTISWSYDLLSPEAQHLLRRLAVFRGGFALDEAQAVSRGIDDPDVEVFDLIATLVDNHLLRREEREDEPHYRMLETVREYGLEQLSASDELEATRRDHAAHFLALAEQAAPAWWGPEPGVWLDRLQAQYGNLREALGWAVEQGEAEIGARLGIALHWLWRVRGPVREGYEWMERVLAQSATIPPVLRAQLLTRAGELAGVQGQYTQAVARQEAGLALARGLGDRRALVWAVGYRGYTATMQGNDDLAVSLLEEATMLAREAGEHFWVAGALGTLFDLAWRRGDAERAAELVEEAAAVCLEERMAWHGASTLGKQAAMAAAQGDVGRAAVLYRDSLAQLWAMGERRDFAACLASFAELVARDDPERGAHLYGVVDALLDAGGVNLTPFGQIHYERALAAASAGLDAAGFEAARAAGRALPPEQVLAELHWPPSDDIGGAPGAAVQARARLGLTERELAVLHLLPSFTYREIAARLFISERTVEHHVHNICAKFGVHHRRDAVQVGKRYGLI